MQESPWDFSLSLFRSCLDWVLWIQVMYNVVSLVPADPNISSLTKLNSKWELKSGPSNLGCVRKTIFELTLVWSGFPFLLGPIDYRKGFVIFCLENAKSSVDMEVPLPYNIFF